MIQNEKLNICKLLRKETGCGLFDASYALNKIIKALKTKPVIYDESYHLLIHCKWEKYDTRR